MDRKKIKAEAKELLKGNVWKILGVIILCGLVVSIANELISKILGAIGLQSFDMNSLMKAESLEELAEIMNSTTTSIGNVILTLVSSIISFTVGIITTHYILKIARKEENTLSDSFDFFGKVWKKTLLVAVIYSVCVEISTIVGLINVNIITLIFEIADIVITIGLAFTDCVLIDSKDNEKGLDIIKKSWELTKGHKWKIFVFELSFILWILLCIFIIPVIYVIPFISLATAVYYNNLVKKAE